MKIIGKCKKVMSVYSGVCEGCGSILETNAEDLIFRYKGEGSSEDYQYGECLKCKRKTLFRKEHARCVSALLHTCLMYEKK